ncbi:MAG: hypothetical protein EOM59_16700 [Clostridia bacterium]|nr:hypothetical protein [Clostridia bacterium]
MANEKKIHENSLANLKPFSSTRQPKNKNGRKPSQLKKYIKDNNMCREDVALIIKNVLFSKSSDELVNMVQDKSEPMIVRLMVRAYLEDFKKGGLVNLSVLLDRAFGSPKQDVEVSGNITVTEMTYEEREAKINEYISKKYPGNMPGGSDATTGQD